MQVDFDKEIILKMEEVLKNRTLDIKWLDCAEKKNKYYRICFADYIKEIVVKIKRKSGK